MRAVLLCGDRLTAFQRRVVETLIADEAISLPACAVDCRHAPGLATKLRRNLKQGRGGYVLVMAANALLARFRDDGSEATEPFMSERRIPTVLVDDPSAAEQLEPIAAAEPDALVLIGGFGIVKEPLLSLARHGVLSYHHGDMRRYRGMPPAFWELYNGESEIGVTVQRLSPGIDDGAPIVEKSFAIGPRDTLAQVKTRIYGGSVEMMLAALRTVAESSSPPARLESYGLVYTLPNLREWLSFQAKMMRRR